MIKVDTAMIMAAGLGKRMRPLTEARPKPLVEVAGKAMIDHCFEKLVAAGIGKAVVNVHYLADMMEAHLAALPYPIDIQVSDERAQLLETGGGLVQAQPLIAEDIFFCINSDNLWTDGPANSLLQLAEAWDEDRMDALLLLIEREAAHNYQGHGDFHLDGEQRISRKLPDQKAPLIYSGIQLISKRLLRDAPTGPFSTNIFWERAIGEGRLFGTVHHGQWFEVGSPQAIAPTEAALANV
ncbi:nucleotidyltransferase family protein [Sphingorhabdus sp. M41]|uniref:nucleotidyltransferase family protein n=1 Tax=Sphingorhabdus sp. M41 TaxID=1806885 RepID=UPI00078DA3A7|nr:nucleotidyltransferase family protein [Sphingorhabdus sp. M41]AMO71527.1 mannose-1-phosphate guanylyltransferase [Sphingorhabdus sp. M41]